MKLSSLRNQLLIIGLGYAAILAFAAAAFYARYVWYRNHPVEAMASSGMYAGGDAMLAIFVVCLLMIPSIFLVWVGAKFEAPFTVYSTILFWVALSAPVCLGLLLLGEKHIHQYIFAFCFFRLVWSPFLLALMGFSRFVARFDRAKRLNTYALLSEGLTLFVSVALIVQSMWSGKH